MAKSKVQTSDKYKLTVSLDKSLARRFAAYCALKGQDQCDVIERAIRKEMVGFRVSLVSADGESDQVEPTARPIGLADGSSRVA